MYALDFKVMGCQARLVLDDDGGHARAALQRCADWLLACEQVLSRFDPDSALSRLNATGFAEHVDDVLWDAVDVALTAANATHGLVTPTILGSLERAGYDRSFDTLERAQSAPIEVSSVPDWRVVERDGATRSIRLPAGVRLDLGGTAKGWCADVAASRLGRSAPALVDLGGDIAMTESGRDPWPIAIEDPRGGDGPLVVVIVRGGAVATSGRDVRRWSRAGAMQHHIIDPRRGAPACTDVWAASVVGASALDAEIAAKRVLIEGSVAGLRWLETEPDLAAIVVRDDGEIVQSSRFERHIWRTEK